MAKGSSCFADAGLEDQEAAGEHRRIVAGRNYPAYSFTNHSSDILKLFVWACSLIGLRARRANRVTVSIARRADVAKLDNLFGAADGLEPSAKGLSPLRTP